MRLRALVIWGHVALGGTGCAGRGPTAASPSRPLDGRFALVAVNGLAVPARLSEVPSRDGSGTGCYEVVTEGWLALDSARGTFSVGARRRDTCGVTSFGGDTSATGRYAWRAGAPHLTVHPGDSPVEAFPARLARDTLEVYDTYTHTRYRYLVAASGSPSPGAAHTPPNEALQRSGTRGQGSAAADHVVSSPPRALAARS